MSVRCDALVGYGWCRASYVALRSLHRLGLRVAVADEYRVGMALWSRFAAARFRHADFRTHPLRFLDDINNIIAQTGVRFFLPGHDEGELVARHRHMFEPDVCIPLHDHEMIALANNKAAVAGVAAELGIPVPRRVDYTCVDDLVTAPDPACGSYVIKLLRGTSAKGVFYAATADQARALVGRLVRQYDLPADRYPLVQERVRGEGWGVSCLYWHGRRVAAFTHRRLREKTVTGGTSTVRVSAHNAVLEGYAYRLLDHLAWHGLAMVEFKWDPRSRRGWFIEMNPRLWGSIALPVACGVDFPALTYIAATRGADTARAMAGQYKTGIKARWYLGDVIRGLGQCTRLRLIDAARCLWPGGHDVCDDLPFDDLGALVGQWAFYLTRFMASRSMNPTDNVLLG